jgi:UDP-N-acetylglucosamine acyltransferase
MISPLAHIHPEARIGAKVTIEPFAVIAGDVEIGDGSWIGSHTVISDGARLGKNVKVFPGATVSAVPQDLKFAGEVTMTHIGDNTVIRECVNISRGTTDKMKTVIGRNCLLMGYVHVAHDCEIGNNVILVNSVLVAGHVAIDDFAIIGGASAIHQFVKIGAHVMVSGGSLVRKDIPPFTKAAREPLGYVGINSVGLRRRGFGGEKISEIQEIYRMIYLKGLNNSDALSYIEMNMSASKERDEILNFVRNSERGIMKGFSNSMK